MTRRNCSCRPEKNERVKNSETKQLAQLQLLRWQVTFGTARTTSSTKNSHKPRDLDQMVEYIIINLYLIDRLYNKSVCHYVFSLTVNAYGYRIT